MNTAIHSFWTAFKALPPAQRWHTILFWIFWLYIVTFAVGPSVREVLPTLCGLCLIPYYRHNWHTSTLRRFGAWWLFLFFAAAALWGTVFSTDVWASFLHVGRGVNKAFILPFVAMECTRNSTDLRRLVWAIVLACLWQGCNGIWQSITGYDFIDNTRIIAGRLTGSLSDYRVGNYIALMLIPAVGVYFILRDKLTFTLSVLACLFLLGPGIYLLCFTYTRNGYLAVIAAAALWFIITGAPKWKAAVFTTGALLAVTAFVPQRMGADAMSRDGRWELWRFAWDIFCEYPLTGAGFWQYNPTFRALGHVPIRDPITISHPHNMYLQLLCESGLVGFALMILFLLGMLLWGYRKIAGPLRTELRAELASAHAPALDPAPKKARTDTHWRLTALFWCAWGAYLVSGIFGHDFFRIWWQAVVMTHLGIMIGAIINNIPEKT